MNKTKYNQLKEEIIKVVPEIRWRKCSVCGYIHPEGNFGYCNINGCECFLNNRCEQRDITLEDCLIALDKVSQNKNRIKMFFEVLDEWQLGKPLQDQSDECKELLWDLICKK